VPDLAIYFLNGLSYDKKLIVNVIELGKMHLVVLDTLSWKLLGEILGTGLGFLNANFLSKTSQSQVQKRVGSKLILLTMESEYSFSGSETESDQSFSSNSTWGRGSVSIATWIGLEGPEKAKPEHKPRAVLPTNLHSIVIMDNHITKALYGQDYKYNTSLRVIGAALHMQKSHLQKVANLGKIKGRLVEKPRIRDTVCDLFHIGHDAYSQIVGGTCTIDLSIKQVEGMRLQRRLIYRRPRWRRSRCEILFEAGEWTGNVSLQGRSLTSW
jgi:hypothetical protein